MTSLLLIGGAGLPAWIWDDVRSELGGRVAERPGAGARLRDYADAALGAAPAGPFTIVAHSAGAVIGVEVARRVPERVDGFLAVSGVVPRPGGAFLSALPAPNRWVLGALVRVVGTRPPESAIRGGLAHGLPGGTADRIVADFVPESPWLYRDRTGSGPWTGRRGYVHTGRDRELPMSVQRRSAERLGAAWTTELGTGHLPMIENAGALARAITDFLAEAPVGVQ